LPAEFETTKMKSFNVPVHVAWEFITSVEDYPEHRDEYSAIQEISRRNGHMYEFQALMTDGKLAAYQINNYVPEKHFSYQLMKSSHEMKGFWNFFFYGDSAQCTIEITEQSRMGNPIEKVFWYLTNRSSRIDREFELLEELVQ
jgi:hypothetical protein